MARNPSIGFVGLLAELASNCATVAPAVNPAWAVTVVWRSATIDVPPVQAYEAKTSFGLARMRVPATPAAPAAATLVSKERRDMGLGSTTAAARFPVAFSSCAALASARVARSSAFEVRSSSWVRRANRSDRDGTTRCIDELLCRLRTGSSHGVAVRPAKLRALYITAGKTCRPASRKRCSSCAGQAKQAPELQAQIVLEVRNVDQAMDDSRDHRKQDSDFDRAPIGV